MLSPRPEISARISAPKHAHRTPCAGSHRRFESALVVELSLISAVFGQACPCTATGPGSGASGTAGSKQAPRALGRADTAQSLR
jgi:hypothetical protein